MVKRTRRDSWASTTEHPFQATSSDHAETPLDAYVDLEPALRALSADKQNLLIYDPYYAAGGVKTRLASLGYTSVINRNRDFYTDDIPDYDVLVTNPPYSADHVERLVGFALAQRKPFAFLLPTYVLARDFWRPVVDAFRPFYCMPRKRYAYEPPAFAREPQAERTTAPFPTGWFVWLGHGVEVPAFPPTRVEVFLDLDAVSSDYRDITDPRKKRPNPRSRKKQHAKRAKHAANYHRQ